MEPQFPQQQTARDLLRACASSRLTATGRERRRYCAGFVSGVEEAIRLLNLSGRSRFRLCTPEDVTAWALADAFVRYGASHEGELDDPAASVVHHALTLAYPCGDRDE
ncbi:MAG: Rap1a/Tai family immunity protein [Gammaproteobacteria bacterium]|jgi:DNA-binding transcriptional LysR family regulator